MDECHQVSRRVLPAAVGAWPLGKQWVRVLDFAGSGEGSNSTAEVKESTIEVTAVYSARKARHVNLPSIKARH
jgi:hypothetical protein